MTLPAFKIFSQRSGGFKLRVCLLLFLCFILADHVAGQDKSENSESFCRNSEKLKNEPQWYLAPVGEAAIQFLRIFYKYTRKESPIRRLIREKNSNLNEISKTMLAHFFFKQITMSIFTVLGVLCVLLLVLMPCSIYLYRKNQVKRMEESQIHSNLVSPRQGVLISEFLYAFLLISLFGGFLTCFSLVELRSNIPKGFDFAAYAVNISYGMKEKTLNKFHYNLFDISVSVFETIQRMHDVNDDVHQKLMKEVNLHVDPIIYSVRSIKWNVADVRSSLVKLRESLGLFTRNSNQKIKNLTNKYLSTLTNLSKILDKEKRSTIDPLFEITNYSSNATFEDFDESLKRLKAVSELKLEDKFQTLTSYFHDAVENITYDPSNIIEDLKEISFSSETKIRETIGEYVPYLERHFPETLKRKTLYDIKSIRKSVLKTLEKLYIAFLALSALSVFLGTFFSVFFLLGILGTKGFRIEFPGSRGYKSGLSDRSGKIIVFFLYISAIFLVFFWTLSIILFMTSTIPLKACLSAVDKSLFEFNLDFPASGDETDSGGYRMETFPEFLNKHISECEKDPSYSRILSDRVFNHSSFEDVKEKVNTENMSNEVQNAFKNIPNINISEISDLDLKNITNLDLHAYFQNIEDFRKELNEENTSSVLKSIYNRPRSSKKVKETAQATLKSFRELTAELWELGNKENYFIFAMRPLNVTMTMIITEVENFKITSEILNEFLKGNISDLYISILKETVFDLINIVLFNLEWSVYYFRKSISICSTITLLYKKFTCITCGLILNPMAASWMGSFFVDIFLLLSVLLCLYAVPLFLKPVREHFFTPPPVIHMHDFPSTPRDRMGPWAQATAEPASQATSSHSESTLSRSKSVPFLHKAKWESAGRNIQKYKTPVPIDSLPGNSANVTDVNSEESEFTNTQEKNREFEENEDSEIALTKSLPYNSKTRSTKTKNMQNKTVSEYPLTDISDRSENLVKDLSVKGIKKKLESSGKKENTESISLREILRLHDKLGKNENLSFNFRSFKDSSNAGSSTATKSVPKDSQDKTMRSLSNENAADIKEMLREILTGINRNESIALDSESYKDENSSTTASAAKESTSEDSEDKTMSCVNKENSVDIKETKSLHKILTGEKRNENFSPDSESSKDERSSIATSTDSESITMDPQDKTGNKDRKSLREILRTHCN